MKLPRLITRRRAKWVGIVLATATAVIAAYSTSLENQPPRQRTDVTATTVWLEPGSVRFHWVRKVPRMVGFRESVQTRNRGGFEWAPLFVPKIERYTIVFWLDSSESTRSTDLLVPLGSLAILFALPTAYLWRTDRAKPWQCPKCRYDLRGLEGGVCPECGEVSK